jgi:hypothetical protein
MRLTVVVADQSGGVAKILRPTMRANVVEFFWVVGKRERENKKEREREGGTVGCL